MNDGYIAQDDRERREGERERGCICSIGCGVVSLRFISIAKWVKFREIQASLNFVPKSSSLMPWVLQHFWVHSTPFYCQYLGYFQCYPVKTCILSHCLALQDGWKMQELGFPHFLIHPHSDPHLIEVGYNLRAARPKSSFGFNCNCVTFWLLVMSWIVAGQQGTCAGGRGESELCEFR